MIVVFAMILAPIQNGGDPHTLAGAHARPAESPVEFVTIGPSHPARENGGKWKPWLAEVPVVLQTSVKVPRPRISESEQARVYVIDPRSDREYLAATVPNLDVSRYRSAEAHGRFLFAIKRVRAPGPAPAVYRGWTNELWRIDLVRGDRKQILSRQGFDFRAAPDGKLVAVGDGLSISFVRLDGIETCRLTLDDLGFTPHGLHPPPHLVG